MAVVSVNEIHEERRGELGRKYRLTLQRSFLVITDSASDGPNVAVAAGGLPSLYAAYPGEATAVLIRKRAEPLSRNQKQWRVVCEYSNETEEGDENQTDPLTRPNVVSFGTVPYTRPVEKDNQGHAIANTLGDTFDPPLEQEDYRLAMTITRNVSQFDAGAIGEYLGCTNSDFWSVIDSRQQFTFPAKTVLFTELSAGPQTENGVAFYQLSYGFQIRNERWNPRKVLNQGFRYADGQGVIKKVEDDLGDPAAAPRVLLFNGQLCPGPPYVNAYFNEFNTYRERPFSALLNL